MSGVASQVAALVEAAKRNERMVGRTKLRGDGWEVQYYY